MILIIWLKQSGHTYKVRANGGRDYIRRINVELAPMEVADFAKLKAENIGTYVCFQETYDPLLYQEFPSFRYKKRRLRISPYSNGQGHGRRN